jgi:hypothetical protein
MYALKTSQTFSGVNTKQIQVNSLECNYMTQGIHKVAVKANKLARYHANGCIRSQLVVIVRSASELITDWDKIDSAVNEVDRIQSLNNCQTVVDEPPGF